MESTLKVLAAHQLMSGQFPTIVANEAEGIRKNVHTITPTYLICVILNEIRERGYSHPLLDGIVQKGAEFLSRMCYMDPVTRLRVWHFNAFYMPDWEETAWNSYLLHKLGFFTKKELAPLRTLAHTNETHDRGVGVWLKDTYSERNRYSNVFDPVVSLSVNQFLMRVFGECSEPTESFLVQAIASQEKSLYYADNFRDFLFFLFNRAEKPKALIHDRGRLFHHGNRVEVWYQSPDVWEVAELAMSA